MRRSSKKVTLVGRTNTIWQELDEYHRKNRRRMFCRTEDIDECLERQSQIEKEVGKLIDTDLDITWHNKYYIKGIPYVIQDLNGKYRMSQRDRNGRLRPIVTNWTELKKRAIKFISDVKFRTVQSPVQSPV